MRLDVRRPWTDGEEGKVYCRFQDCGGAMLRSLFLLGLLAGTASGFMSSPPSVPYGRVNARFSREFLIHEFRWRKNI